MSDLKQQAEALGIKVDGRWSDERLLKEIDDFVTARNAGAGTIPPSPDAVPPSPGETNRTPGETNLIAVRVLRDFWDDKGERHAKGSIVEVPVEAALDGVEAGKLSRVKG